MSPAKGARGRGDERRFGGAGVSAFGEMLVAGLGVAVLALPLVTLAPAVAAGVRHLDAHLDHEQDSVRRLASLGLQAIRSGWWFGLASTVVMGLLMLNTIGGMQGLLPGGTVLALVSGALAAVVAVATLRTAALWHPGARWSQLWRAGRNLVLDDPIGDAFVLIGVGVAITVVWMLPPLIVIAPGLIVVSLVAAERRRMPAQASG
ncbi:hypothetical protein [Microbacterium phyllosphaerae]|uniref:hypothetical protein n=1 Tax=Microbacterium phyllosphaerae TaxID=124798 RepID=UPI003D650A30